MKDQKIKGFFSFGGIEASQWLMYWKPCFSVSWLICPDLFSVGISYWNFQSVKDTGFSAESMPEDALWKKSAFSTSIWNSYLRIIPELPSVQFWVSECQILWAEPAPKFDVCMICMLCVTGWLHKDWWEEAGRGDEGWSELCKQILPESFQGCLQASSHR